VEHVKFRSIPNTFPSPSELDDILKDIDAGGWEEDAEKQSFSKAFDRLLRIHLNTHYTKHCNQTQENSEKSENFSATQPDKLHAEAKTNRDRIERITFVHMFAFPLFKIMAANWARLIVRRSFDLDLLEWRPEDRVTSTTIDEIKSRRVAITRHQRFIKYALEVVGALTREEWKRNCDSTESELSGGPKICNALVGKDIDDDSWESLYWDYSELKDSINALETRATKIQDGLIGLIQVHAGELSHRLNRIAFFFSVFLLPFSIVGSIWSAGLHAARVASDNEDSIPPKDVNSFWHAIVATFFVSCFLTILVWNSDLTEWTQVARFQVMRRWLKLQDRARITFHYKKLRMARTRWQSEV